jgi:hypothetical protein
MVAVASHPRNDDPAATKYSPCDGQRSGAGNGNPAFAGLPDFQSSRLAGTGETAPLLPLDGVVNLDYLGLARINPDFR